MRTLCSTSPVTLLIVTSGRSSLRSMSVSVMSRRMLCGGPAIRPNPSAVPDTFVIVIFSTICAGGVRPLRSKYCVHGSMLIKVPAAFRTTLRTWMSA